VRSPHRENQLQPRLQTSPGAHAPPDGVSRGSGGASQEVPQHSFHFDLLLARLPHHSLPHPVQTPPTSQRKG
jgi:hypothetical protein